MKAIARAGTPCWLMRWKKRGNCPSTDIWCSERAQPMIAFSAESISATMSMIAMIQFSDLAAGVEELCRRT